MGTPALKPYMHGYFLSLKLYDAARVIANPFAYAEHRERMVREKMDKMAEGRIRAKKGSSVKVNKALAEKIQKEEEKERKREDRKQARRAQKELEAENAMDVDPAVGVVDKEQELGGKEPSTGDKPTLLNDPRFTQLFENPEFAVDEATREYALMNPSAVARKMNGAEGSKSRQSRTAVEDEEEESDKASSDGLGGSDSSDEGGDSDDSSDAGGKLHAQSLLPDVLIGDPQNSTHSILERVPTKKMSGFNRHTLVNVNKIVSPV